MTGLEIVLIAIVFAIGIFICGMEVGKAVQVDRQQKELMKHERKWTW